ncbi:MAG: sigma 54-interacting transcriptional regulator [Acidobacteria bacterium]|nr:sigma 54-interacting transcriptional regulator [Acidobacteriota bacterium]
MPDRTEVVIGDYAPLILVCDHQESRRQFVQQVISCCGAKPDFLDREESATTIQDLLSASSGQRSLVAVFAVGGMPSPDNPIVEMIHSLKERGFKIVAYEDGASEWPLGLQCRALLAGSQWLLDSAQPDFVSELKDRLFQLLREESERIAVDAKIKSEMKQLGLVGEAEEMVSVFRSVKRVSALSDLSTLITGETGTGKELLARAIHQLDLKRQHGPFVAINCGAINSSVAESELFGHRRGAFTGAEKDRRGLIRSANGGVLFLDEIGELDAGLQTKFLRVLQENRVLGLGDDLETSVNVRIIAATNRDLKEMVKAGTFRADLFHRLNLLSIHVPPLRQRPADIQPLVAHFLQKHAALRPGVSLVPGNKYLTALTLLDLPGNIRQLENVIRWTMVNKEDESALNLSDLPLELLEQLAQQSDSFRALATTSMKSPPEGRQSNLSAQLMQVMTASHWNLAQSLEYCEKLLLESALHLAKGNQTQTAKLLGLTPRSVYSKVRKHHLDH